MLPHLECARRRLDPSYAAPPGEPSSVLGATPAPPAAGISTSTVTSGMSKTLLVAGVATSHTYNFTWSDPLFPKFRWSLKVYGKFNVMGLPQLSLLLFCFNITFAAVYVLQNAPFNVVVSSFDDAVSLFGPELFHVDGFLVAAVPSNACTRIAPAPDVNVSKRPESLEKMSSLPYIALIERGRCNFDLKVLNAQLAGYFGAIVYNTKDDEIFPMSGTNHSDEIRIPSVMVDRTAGNRLQSFTVTKQKKEYLVSMVSFYSLPLKYVLLSLLILVGASLVVLIACFTIHLCNLWRRIRRGRLSRRHLRQLPTKRFQKGRDPYDTCSVCLEDYKDRDKIRILPCHHVFHTLCIDPWLLRNRRRCPVCNQNVELSGAPSQADQQDEDTVITHPVHQWPFIHALIWRLRHLNVPTAHGVRRNRFSRTDHVQSSNNAASSAIGASASSIIATEDEERPLLLEPETTDSLMVTNANSIRSSHNGSPVGSTAGTHSPITITNKESAITSFNVDPHMDDNQLLDPSKEGAGKNVDVSLPGRSGYPSMPNLMQSSDCCQSSVTEKTPTIGSNPDLSIHAKVETDDDDDHPLLLDVGDPGTSSVPKRV
ncbi:unnamed protein product [Calicophoron daubneyi]|uniref:RING-type domain-containing protein n=1 Tax=Calicophoron daubneyi TaxID=300641 RepID=A0AAV2THB7_CALDB